MSCNCFGWSKSGNSSGGTITGGGTVNRYAKFTAATAIGDGLIYDDGVSVVTIEGDFVPNANGTRNLGSTSLGWDNLYLASNINYATNLLFKSGGSQKLSLDTNGLMLFNNNQGLDVVLSGGTDTLNIGTGNADVINMGWSGAAVNIIGTVLYENVTNLQVKDKLITINKGGGAASGGSAGIEIEEAAIITGYFTTNSTRDGWNFKAPAITGVANLDMSLITGNHNYTLQDGSGTLAFLSDITSNSWLLAGNALAGTEKFGSTNAQPVTFYTNNSARGIIDSSGNFGFGTTSPSHFFDIVKNQNSDTFVTVNNNSNGVSALCGFSVSADVSMGSLVALSSTNTSIDPSFSGDVVVFGDVTAHGLRFLSDKSIFFHTNSSATVTGVNHASGNWSFGSSVDSGDKIYVSGGTRWDTALTALAVYIANSASQGIMGINTNALGAGWAGFLPNFRSHSLTNVDISDYGIYANGVASGIQTFWIVDGGGGTEMAMGTNTAHKLAFRTTNIDRMTILSTGEVGIGITAPTATAHLKGSNAVAGTYTLKVDDSASNQMLYVQNDGSVAGGYNSSATGQGAICFGRNASASALAAVSFGNATVASNVGSIAMGDTVIASGDHAVAIGNESITASATNSFAMGRFVTVSNSAAMAMGMGVDNANRLVNNIAGSIMFGMSSTVPTLIITNSSGAGTWGNVGIGTTVPTSQVTVKNFSAGQSIQDWYNSANALKLTLNDSGNLIFANNAVIDVTLSGGTDTINFGTGNADVINMGWSGATVNIIGTVLYENVTNLQVADKLITINKGGGAASGGSAGIEIEENGSITGYLTTSSARTGWDFKAPAVASVATLLLSSLTGNRIFTLPDLAGTFALTANNLSVFASTTSAQLAGVISDETGGSGVLVFNSNPTLAGYTNSATVNETNWVQITGNTTTAAADYLYHATTTATLTLQAISTSGYTGKVFRIYVAPSVTLTINPNAADTIFGLTTLPVAGGANGASLTLRASGVVANTWVIGD